MIDARHLKLICRRWVVPPRLRARTKPQPCVCPGPYYHPFCWVVTCKCDHGLAPSVVGAAPATAPTTEGARP